MLIHRMTLVFLPTVPSKWVGRLEKNAKGRFHFMGRRNWVIMLQLDKIHIRPHLVHLLHLRSAPALKLVVAHG